jgi:hypothetical protein
MDEIIRKDFAYGGGAVNTALLKKSRLEYILNAPFSPYRQRHDRFIFIEDKPLPVWSYMI